MRSKLKREYQEIFLEIRKIMNDADPAGLIALSAPEDEYDPEVGEILVRLGSCNSEKEVVLMFADVLKKWFSDDICLDDSGCKLIAEQLFRLKSKYSFLK